MKLLFTLLFKNNEKGETLMKKILEIIKVIATAVAAAVGAIIGNIKRIPK